jgi:hypothetical protein
LSRPLGSGFSGDYPIIQYVDDTSDLVVWYYTTFTFEGGASHLC